MSYQTYQYILLERRGHVGIITMNRPDKRNAVDYQMAAEFCSAMQELNNDREVRVITIRSEGDNFCTGEDIFALQDERAAFIA